MCNTGDGIFMSGELFFIQEDDLLMNCDNFTIIVYRRRPDVGRIFKYNWELFGREQSQQTKCGGLYLPLVKMARREMSWSVDGFYEAEHFGTTLGGATNGTTAPLRLRKELHCFRTTFEQNHLRHDI